MGTGAVDNGIDSQMHPFDYSAEAGAAANGSESWSELVFKTIGGSAAGIERDLEPMPVERPRHTQDPEALQLSFEAGWQKGMEDGRQAERAAEMAERRNEERSRREQIGKALQEFALERDTFLRDIEHEVVDLALGIAARILRREAQMDPLLLSGAVRVALGQLGQATEVRIRVPVSDASLWREAFAHTPNLTLQPEVIATEGMNTGDCRMETHLGSVDLGLRAQLAEIEKGFFDRRGKSRKDGRPEAADTTARGTINQL